MNPALKQVTNAEAVINPYQKASCMESSQGEVAFDLNLAPKLRSHLYPEPFGRAVIESCFFMVGFYNFTLFLIHPLLEGFPVKIPFLRPVPLST